MLNETNSFMSKIHLSRLVEQGLWGDAITYISRFLGPPTHPHSDEAKVLHYFLRNHKAFHSMVTGEHDQDVKRLYQSYKQYPKHDDSVPLDALRIRSITTSLLYSEPMRYYLLFLSVRAIVIPLVLLRVLLWRAVRLPCSYSTLLLLHLVLFFSDNDLQGLICS
jgi:hypothetical protein